MKPSQVNPTSLAPLLRWAGSKRKLLPHLISNSPTRFVRYVEPFAGSACLFFALGPSKAILGDFNRELIAFYEVVRRTPRALFRCASEFPMSRDYYYELRSRDARTMSPIQAAARFLYLNRFCFNGVYRTNRKGQFNVPFGTRTGTLPSLTHIENVSQMLRRADLTAADFGETVQQVRRGDFVYIDPPYAARRYRGEYGYGAFSLADTNRLSQVAEELDSKGATFLISYQHDRRIARQFRMWHQSRVSVRRHVAGFAGARGVVTELLISNMSFKGYKT